jgi:hypothetical protein
VSRAARWLVCASLVGIALLGGSAPLDAPAAQAAGGWWLMYASAGDIWETDGSQVLQLTNDGHLSQPALNGGVLVWVHRDANGSDIWAASGSDPPHALTHNVSATISANHWAAQPTVAADGASLFLLSDYNPSTTGVGDLAIWQLDLPQARPRQITKPAEYTGGDQDIALSPSNPHQLVFTRYGYGNDQQQLEQLNWLDLNVGVPVALTPPESPSRQLAFAPDGQHVAFVQSDSGGEHLYAGQLDTSGSQPQLTDVNQVDGGVTAQPTWRADGNAIAYIALINHQFQLWTMNVNVDPDGHIHTDTPHQLGHVNTIDATSRPVWLTDDEAHDVQTWLAEPAAS